MGQLIVCGIVTRHVAEHGAWIIFPAFFTLHVRSPSSPKKELAATVTRHPISPYARLVFLMTTQTAKCGAERVMDGCHP